MQKAWERSDARALRNVFYDLPRQNEPRHGGHEGGAAGGNIKEIIALIFISWGVAFFEYIFMVPANNYFGKIDGFSPFQLKIIQEVLSLIIFAGFAVLFLQEKWRWNYAVSFVLIAAATYFMFLPVKEQ